MHRHCLISIPVRSTGTRLADRLAIRLPVARGRLIVWPALLLAALCVASTPRLPAGERPDSQPIDFNQSIAPILSDNCFACHGPDAEQRQADLRLDRRDSALALLDSGERAVVPGDAKRSELYRRLLATDDEERMPPAETGHRLTSDQIDLIRRWIDQGAPWDVHWAFTPLCDNGAPPLDDRGSLDDARRPATPIDRFVRLRLHDQGLEPVGPATRRELIRRVYFDLVGLPPAPSDIERFVDDRSPKAYERLVDRLLASPTYGQRWARHWLDVARYGDSNGGDENHLYPFAFHYRNYVVAAFNADMPFDRFVHEQLAGDLLESAQSADGRSWERLPIERRPVTATGFLAIGMKILAEQDPVKKRADMVDEQIDTFGRALLGLTLGCARCHDHKFDPVPTTDYYALAGIFHSTDVGDREVWTADIRRRRDELQRQAGTLMARQNTQLMQLQSLAAQQGQSTAPAAARIILRQAEDFDKGNVAVLRDGYGEGIGIIGDPGPQQNYAQYEIRTEVSADYLLQVRYAAADSRPGKVLLNGKLVCDNAFAAVTGGWYPQHQRWHSVCPLRLPAGENRLRWESHPLMVHVDQFRLLPLDQQGELEAFLQQIEQTDARLAELRQSMPQPARVMAVSDGDVHNVRVHQRGSHLSLGEIVPRHFLTSLSVGQESRPGSIQSGRLELAHWLTAPNSPASALLARVIVNRTWLWHFGQGLVGTPDNFGLQGDRPTHPALLDYLAVDLIRHRWSLKHLHRQILLSDAYRRSAHGASQFDRPARAIADYALRRPRRMEAEAFRDTLLAHAGEIDLSLGGAPPRVKSGDPSPEDLRRNRQVYQKSRRRSVYLPVVRSNTYELLALLDFPDSSRPVGMRPQTIVPTQALLMLNSTFVMEKASQIAERLLQERPDESERIRYLYLLLFSKEPSPGERNAVTVFLTEMKKSGSDERSAWAALCHALVASNRYFYIP